MIGRMFQCSPKDPDLYALRLILLHVAGIKGYSDAKRVDGVPDDDKRSFREAAKLRGLVRNIDDVDHILEEMFATNCSENKQCELFALILVWHDVGDARGLWERHWREIVKLRPEDTDADQAIKHNNALRMVDNTLEHFRLNSKSYLLAPMHCADPAHQTPAGRRECKELEQEKL